MRLIRLASFATAVAVAPLASAQWADDFEGYTTGFPIEGTAMNPNPPWQNWTLGNYEPWNTVVDSGSAAETLPAGSSQCLEVRADNVMPPQTAQALSDTVSTMNGPYMSGQWTYTVDVYVPATLTSRQYFIMMNDGFNGGGGYDWSIQGYFEPTTQTFDLDHWGATANGTLGVNAPNAGVMYDTMGWKQIKIEVDLDSGLTLVYYDGQLMYEFLDWGNILNTTPQAPPNIVDATDLYPSAVDTTSIYYDNFDFSSGIAGVPIGSNYGTTNPNSTGQSGRIDAYGSRLVADNDVTLTATQLGNNSFAFFIASTAQAQVNNPGGSSGNLLLGGQIGRYVGAGQIQNSGATGSVSLAIDLTQIPQPNGFVSATAGQTWNFQCWHRDVTPGGAATSNFTDATAIDFL